jgi:hypothetical protein
VYSIHLSDVLRGNVSILLVHSDVRSGVKGQGLNLTPNPKLFRGDNNGVRAFGTAPVRPAASLE